MPRCIDDYPSYVEPLLNRIKQRAPPGRAGVPGLDYHRLYTNYPTKMSVGKEKR